MVLGRIFSASARADVGGVRRDGTDASPLLGGLLEGEWRHVFVTEVLEKWLDPTYLALLARACWACGEAVVSSGVEIAGETAERPLKVKDFLGSAELMAWGEANGCPRSERTCALAAEGGHLDRFLGSGGSDNGDGGRGSGCSGGRGIRVER
jgi:hypothetical protein